MIRKLIQYSTFSFLGVLLCTFGVNGQDNYDEKHIEVALRMIGHQVLLNAGDSTSRVLPIKKENDLYRINFESELEILPDSLVAAVNKIMADTDLDNGYFVDVEDCESKEKVYSFEMSHVIGDNVGHCAARVLPKACYNLIFSIIPAENKLETSQLSFSQVTILLAIIGAIFYFLWRRKNSSSIDPNLIQLGDYHFDKRNTELVNDEQRIELTSKEADLLLLLYDAVNTTVEREVILNMVWGDDGDYVGRTLDVFISKLRKKLEGNSNVKIVNIRGVGYKLVAAV